MQVNSTTLPAEQQNASVTPEHDSDQDGLPDLGNSYPPDDALAGTGAMDNERVLVDARNRTPNPRSCVTCRRRKVRCDKMHPCANCTRAHIECIFPAPGRAPRKSKKLGESSRDRELVERLRRLEGVVKGLGVDVTDQLELNGEAKALPSSDTTVTPRNDLLDSSKWVEDLSAGQFENKFGRLVVNEGKSRYVNNSFWANLSNEVEDLKGILNQSSEDEDLPSPGAGLSLNEKHYNEYIFGYSSHNVDMLALHPPAEKIATYWQTYKHNVDPLVKVLHIPTVEPTVLSAASHLARLSKGFETLMFAIYYGATTSLDPAACLEALGEERSTLLTRYRFGLEQALARANFLITEELIVLQSFLIFLICLRRNSDARIIWTLTGLVVRMGQTLGVHRDGTHFGLTPFETEMRRRVWWQICILDTRASEDHGCDPTIIEQTFDTKLPLNINDADIMPDSTAFPPERQGCTDISFCLIRCEVSSTFRRINYIPPGPSKSCSQKYMATTLAEKEKWIADCHQRLEEKYLKDCDMTVPLYWVTATVARLMMSKMWLMVYHPLHRHDGGAGLPTETKEKLFITSLENIEYSLLLETETRTRQWGWLFKTYMQWHALAFLLADLCHRTKGELVERSWIAVEKTRTGRWGDVVSGGVQGGHLWRPLRKLYRKALEARQRGLREEQMEKAEASGTMSTRKYSPNANPMFGHPQRPQMVRAPLSLAQIQRFSRGPEFGQRPLDCHELLRSPKSDAVKGDQLELISEAAKTDFAQLTSQNRATGPMTSDFKTSPLTQANAFDTLSYTNGQGPSFGGNMLDPVQIDFSNFDLPLAGLGSEANLPTDNFNEASLDTGSLDPLMDTTDDVNWASWDQLVRQYGMDVDQVPVQPTTTNWSLANWDTSQARTPGGDWF